MTTEAQSVSGMNPIFSRATSGTSPVPAKSPRVSGGKPERRTPRAERPAAPRKRRRLILFFFLSENFAILLLISINPKIPHASVPIHPTILAAHRGGSPTRPGDSLHPPQEYEKDEAGPCIWPPPRAASPPQ